MKMMYVHFISPIELLNSHYEILNTESGVKTLTQLLLGTSGGRRTRLPSRFRNNEGTKKKDVIQMKKKDVTQTKKKIPLCIMHMELIASPLISPSLGRGEIC